MKPDPVTSNITPPLSSQKYTTKMTANSSMRQIFKGTILALAAAIFGAFLHAAALKELTVTLVVSACLIITCALGLFLLQLGIIEQVDKEANRVEILSKNIEAIPDAVLQFIQQKTMTVQYYKVSDHPEGYDSGYQRIYDEAVKAVCSAQHSIHTLTSYLLDKDADDDKDKQNYFNRLLEHVKLKEGIEYYRLLQHEEGVALDQTADRQYGKHYLESDNLHRANVVLRKMKGTRPTTFIIIDGTTLLWQINSMQGKNGMKMLGMFIIVDPAKVITSHFSREFDEYWNAHSDRINVQEEFTRFNDSKA